MAHIKKFEEHSNDDILNENSDENIHVNKRRANGQFEKGNKPFNTGLNREDYLSPETIEKMKETEFKEGENVGVKNASWKGGIQSTKRDGKFINTGSNERKRIARYNYEKAHGDIPKGWIIYHIDKDMGNDEIDNLIAVPRAILMRLNSNRMNSNYHEIMVALQPYLDEIEEREKLQKEQ